MLFLNELQGWEFKFKELTHGYIELAELFMNEHKVRYKSSVNPGFSGCIHTLAKYAITLVRRDICPSICLRSSKKSFNQDGNVVRRRNVTSNYDININVTRNDSEKDPRPASQVVGASDENIVTPTQEQDNSSNQVVA